MMIFKLSAALVFAASASFATDIIRPLDLSGIRPLSDFEAVKFKTDDSGRARLPKAPPNLTQAHVARMSKIFSGQTGASDAIPDELAYRIINIMARTDMVSGTPVTAADWDRRIAEFERGYATAFPAGTTPTAEQWEKGADSLLTALVARAEDPHTQYLNRQNWRQLVERQRNAGFVGIGAHVGPDPAGVKIARPLPGSSSTSAQLRQNGKVVSTGLNKDDIIISIDRVNAGGMALDEAVQRLRGVAGTTVELRVRRGNQEYDATLTRKHVDTPNSFSRLAAPGVGYVYFAAFIDKTDLDVFGHIDRLKAQGATKLIIDVRGNPGGSLPMVQSIASEFLRDQQDITTTRTQGIVIERAFVDGDGMYKDMPVAVLIDTGSASASEILAAVLKDHARAKIVGWQSYGKGTFQSVIPTEIPVERLGVIIGRKNDGTGVKVTGGGWFSPSGQSINGQHDPATGRNKPGTGGVVPHVSVSVSDGEQEAVMNGITEQLYKTGPSAAYDPALAAAVTLLQQP